MRMLTAVLPVTEEDDRISQFFATLRNELKARGGFAPGQVELFNTGRESMPVVSETGLLTRMSLGQVTMLVLVYELSIIDSVTSAIRAALSLTWPERTDFQVYETTTGVKRPLHLIRGGKT